MYLKKTNAFLGLLSAVALLVHMLYNCFAYFTFYYNPALKGWTSLPLIILVCAHAVCGMCTVFLMGDGTRLDLYPQRNRTTITQRISAALLFPLLIVHLKTFELLNASSEEGNWFMFALLITVQILFYGVATVHTAVSFSKGLVTLGLIGDEKKLKAVNGIIGTVFGLAFLAVSVAVIRGEILMFVLM